jgi:hypothetical protein
MRLQYLSVLILLALYFAGCSSNLETTINPNYVHSGQLQVVDKELSTFDELFLFPASGATVALTGTRSIITQTSPLGYYTFDSLQEGNYEVILSASGCVSSSFFISEPADNGKTHSTVLYPMSWLQVTIDSVVRNTDKQLGVNLYTHIRSMDPSKNSNGTVYLYLSKESAIDPGDPSTYDAIYTYEVGVARDSLGNKCDSVVTIQIQPGLIRNWEGHHFDAGTHVYCVACASPFSAQFNSPTYDAQDRKIFGYLGRYRSNTVELDLP